MVGSHKGEKMAMNNEMNIEKLKNLLITLDTEMVAYRKQVGSMGKYDDVMKVLEEMNAKFTAVEEDKAYTEEMVGKVHDIAQQVNSKFDEFSDALGAIGELKQNVEHLTTNMPQHKHVVTKQELNKVLRVHHDEVTGTLKDYKQGLDRSAKEFEVHHLKHPQVRPVDVDFRNVALDKVDTISKDVAGLKGYAQKNFQGDELSRIHHEIKTIENQNISTIGALDSGSHSNEHIGAHIERSAEKVKGLRSALIGTSVDTGKKEKLHRVLRKRQFRTAHQDEDHVSKVDIGIGKVRESALSHNPIHEAFSDVRKQVYGKELLKEVISDVALAKQQAAPDSIPIALDHVMSNDTVDRLQEMIRVIHAKMAGGDSAGATSEYERAMEFYLKLHEEDKEDLDRSYDALVDAYNKIVDT